MSMINSPASPSPDDQDLLDLFDNTTQSAEAMKRAVLAALVAVLVLIWAPINVGAKVIDVPVDGPTPRPPRTIFTPKPHEVETTTLTPKRDTIPMPDENPEMDPLPIETPDVPIAAPDVAHTGDWDDDFLPDAPEPIETSALLPNTKGLDMPVFTRKVQPNYPQRAVTLGAQGYVILEAVLRRDGTIDEIKVLRGLARGKLGFEDEAMKALKRWQFLPGKLEGRPLDVRMTLKIDFSLNH